MARWKDTLGLWAFGLTKVPLIAFVRPSILKINDQECEIKIPLNYWTRNHLKSMYFGALAVGADVAGGLIAMHLIARSGKKVQLVFSDFKANFFKRPESDVVFRCADGKKIKQQVKETLQTKQRVTRMVKIIAITPKISGEEVVAEFELGLSLKAK